MTEDIRILSCVGGGPMERLSAALRSQGTSAQVEAGMPDSSWRALMAAGFTGRAKARLHAYFAFPLRSVAQLLFDPPAVCVPTTNPFFLPWLCVASAPLHGRPVVPLIYDLYPDALEAGGRATNRRLIAELIRATNRFLFRHADGMVFIGHRMAAHTQAQYGEPARWTVIETGAQTTEFAVVPADQQTGFHRFANGRVLLSYVGNMGLMHDWETLANALPELERTCSAQLAIVIAASGPGVEKLKSAARDISPDFLRFEPPLPDREWAELLRASHISLVTLRDEAKLTCIPSKTFSAMGAGACIVAVAPPDSDLAECIKQNACGVVVAPGDTGTLTNTVRALVQDSSQLGELRQNALRGVLNAYDMPKLAERWRAFLHVVPKSPSRVQQRAKRALDVIGATAGLLALSPVLLGTAAGVRLSVGSPVLFRQPRAGREGKPFELFKFRSMRHPLPHEQGPEFDEVRLTRFGRFVRRASLDELPSLLNVLRGDMSLVGPRPLLLRYVPRYSERQRRRLEVQPGITGWAQVHGRNATDWETRFEQDVWYVDHRSFALDLKILFRTVASVFAQKDISHGAHATMPEFVGGSGASAEQASSCV